MKRHESSNPSGVAVLSPVMDDGFLSRAKFESQAADYLARKIPPDVFIEICDLAYKSAFYDADYAKLVHKYRYLAHMAEENYREAMKDSDAILSYPDENLLHYQMRCTINLRRNNHSNALYYLNKIIEHQHEANVDTSAMQAERESLFRFMGKIKQYQVDDFCREFLGDPKATLHNFSGIPLILTGFVKYVLHYASGIPYLIFEVSCGSIRAIYCQAPRSEIPFIGHLRSPQNASIFGYSLLADHTRIVIHPANLVI